ncbi:unnamed protein product [Sphagnum compactum]
MAVGVLALQGSFREHIACLRKLGVEAMEVRKPEQLEGLAGLIIPGGESTTMAKLAEHYHLFPALREFGTSGKPIWGTCAGLIFLADKAVGQKAGGQDLLGGLDCTVHRNFFGCQLNSFETQLPVPALVSEEGGASSFRAVFIRAPAITEAGPSVEVLAEYTVPSNFQASSLDQVEGQEELQKVIVAVRQKNLMATAFHPELTSDMRWHRYFLKMVNGDKNLECRKESSMMGLPQVKDLPIFREADHLSFDNDCDQG